jgi:hypothetical protein
MKTYYILVVVLLAVLAGSASAQEQEAEPEPEPEQKEELPTLSLELEGFYFEPANTDDFFGSRLWAMWYPGGSIFFRLGPGLNYIDLVDVSDPDKIVLYSGIFTTISGGVGGDVHIWRGFYVGGSVNLTLPAFPEYSGLAVDANMGMSYRINPIVFRLGINIGYWDMTCEGHLIESPAFAPSVGIGFGI